MSSIEMYDIGDLKIGSYIMMDGSPCKISKMDKSKTGKHGHAKYRTEAIGLMDGKKRVLIIVGGTKVEVPIVDKKNAQVLSVSENKAQLMDLESFETFEAIIEEELLGKVKEGDRVLYWDVLGVKVVKQSK